MADTPVHLDGGFEVVDTNNTDVLRAANVAVDYYNDNDKNPFGYTKYSLNEVTKAEKQVVKGWNYKISFIAGKIIPIDLIGIANCDALVYENLSHEFSVKTIKCNTHIGM